jgi:hypothetical protein
VSALYDLAHEAVAQAIEDGLLARPSACEVCGVGPDRHLVYHHPDYTRPLDVIPLCASCHARVHAGRIPEPRTGRWYPASTTPEPTATPFGLWLRSFRRAQRLTVPDMAARAGVTEQAVYHWEAGRKLPRPANLVALLDASGIHGDARLRVYCLYFDDEAARARTAEAA